MSPPSLPDEIASLQARALACERSLEELPGALGLGDVIVDLAQLFAGEHAPALAPSPAGEQRPYLDDREPDLL